MLLHLLHTPPPWLWARFFYRKLVFQMGKGEGQDPLDPCLPLHWPLPSPQLAPACLRQGWFETSNSPGVGLGAQLLGDSNATRLSRAPAGIALDNIQEIIRDAEPFRERTQRNYFNLLETFHSAFILQFDHCTKSSRSLHISDWWLHILGSLHIYFIPWDWNGNSQSRVSQQLTHSSLDQTSI